MRVVCSLHSLHIITNYDKQNLALKISTILAISNLTGMEVYIHMHMHMTGCYYNQETWINILIPAYGQFVSYL